MNFSLILTFIVWWNYTYAFDLLNFKSGEELCRHHDSLQDEYSKWINVPINYSNSLLATKIYSYTKKPFNKNLPTILFFTGGPGVSSRQSEFEVKNVNIIFFEQRGISCSIPKDAKTFLDPRFYSSENTANDAEIILKKYNIKKATIYGHSYGTIPATLFAVKFPNLTQNLILEGVVYRADRELWNSQIRLNFFQDVFNSLSTVQQNMIINLSKEKLPANWFSKMGNMFLYLNNGRELFINFLNNTFNMDEDAFISFAKNFIPSIDLNENFYFGNVAMGMIGCQEMSMNNPALTMSLIIKNNQFEFYNQNEDFEYRCKPLNLIHSPAFYSAENLKLKVPTYYFLGDSDGATDIYQGLAHWRNVSAKNGKVLILKQGGHLPILGLLKDNRECRLDETFEECQSLLQNKVAEKMINNITKNKFETRSIEELNASGKLNFYLYQE